MSDEETVPFEIHLGLLGPKRVLFGRYGEQRDVTSEVSAVQVNTAEGQPTTVVLKQRPGAGVIKGEGIVQVMAEQIPAEMIFDMLDHKEIEAKALSQQGWGEGPSLTETIISIIKEEFIAARS